MLRKYIMKIMIMKWIRICYKELSRVEYKIWDNKWNKLINRELEIKNREIMWINKMNM